MAERQVSRTTRLRGLVGVPFGTQTIAETERSTVVECRPARQFTPLKRSYLRQRMSLHLSDEWQGKEPKSAE